MGKVIETKIRRFDGGISNDPRDPRENTCRMVSNFDILTNPTKMTPYRNSESGDSAAATSKKQNFCLGYWNPTGTANDKWKIFSLGVKYGAATAEILMKDITVTVNDLSDDGWDTPANNQSSTGSTHFELFLYYKKTGKIYGAMANQYIWEFTPDGATGWNDSKYDYGSTFTYISQGLIHSKDDIMYFGIDNKIIKNDNGTFSIALTLPTHLYITSVCEYGNYLAIACSPLSGVGESYVYIWDRNASLATLDECVNWGNGILKVLDTINSYLIGISLIGGSTTTIKDRVVLRYYVSGESKKFKELTLSTSSQIPIAKQKVGNRLYFMMAGTISGVFRDGVWSIGRESVDSPFSLVHERTCYNDTPITVTGVLKNFFICDDYMFTSFVHSDSAYYLYKTNNTSNYSITAIYESKRFDGGDASLKKDLLGVTVTTEYLPTTGQVVLKYRTDHNTSWTNIFTEATDNSISYSAVNPLPKEYKEIEFRIESYGGAEITGYSFKEDIIAKDKPYE